jgi:hypothetical protein
MHMHICKLHARVHACMHACTHKHAYACMHACVHAQTCICMHACTKDLAFFGRAPQRLKNSKSTCKLHARACMRARTNMHAQKTWHFSDVHDEQLKNAKSTRICIYASYTRAHACIHAHKHACICMHAHKRLGVFQTRTNG